jgi:hypothetical protein
MLYGFSGHSQVLVEEDRPKTTFVTPWRNYAYVRMPFRLKNLGAIFQREMDHAFKDFIGKFMVDYQHELTVYSKSGEIHIRHIKNICERCKMYGV